MGCGQSKIDNEESVARCKERRNLIKEAVTARNAFASAHSGYTICLKNTGAALSDYAEGEAPPPSSVQTIGPTSEPFRPPPPPIDRESSLPPPPPPLPSFSPSPVPPLQRAMTMPEFSSSKPTRVKMMGIDENEDEEEEEEADEKNESLRHRNRRQQNQTRPEENSIEESPLRTPNPPPPPESKGMAWDYFFTMDNIPGLGLEEEEDEDEDDYDKIESESEKFHNVGGGNGSGNEFKTPEKVGSIDLGFKTPEKVGIDLGFKTPEKVGIDMGMETEEEVTPVVLNERHFMHSNTAPPVLRGEIGAVVSNNVNLLKIFNDVDDHFLKASECAHDVSRMLEATRLHYDTNFADNRGHIDHAARVMRVITWNRSFRGMTNGVDAPKDEHFVDDYETHAMILDKLLAWEKKLFEEVKTGELMKLEYQRKVARLNKLKKHNASHEELEKAKAAVSHLHTRYIVDMQSLDSTVSEVNDIRDNELYPQLLALVDGMTKMWESMCLHHDNQLKIVTELKPIDVSGAPKETSKHHHEQTIQLLNVIEEWHLQFDNLIKNQKLYIQLLNNWLKLNLVPIESSLKEKVSSPQRYQTPPIQPLLQTWHDYLERLPDELAKTAMVSFAAVVKTIIVHQEEEMKMKEKCEETRKEYVRKSRAFDDWYQKYMQRKNPSEEATTGEDAAESGSTFKDPIGEKQFLVDSLKKRLEDEMGVYEKHCIQVREKSIGSLKIRLPEVFRAMSDYAHACFDAYQRLRSLSLSQNGPNGVPS